MPPQLGHLPGEEACRVPNRSHSWRLCRVLLPRESPEDGQDHAGCPCSISSSAHGSAAFRGNRGRKKWPGSPGATSGLSPRATDPSHPAASQPDPPTPPPQGIGKKLGEEKGKQFNKFTTGGKTRAGGEPLMKSSGNRRACRLPETPPLQTEHQRFMGHSFFITGEEAALQAHASQASGGGGGNHALQKMPLMKKGSRAC